MTTTRPKPPDLFATDHLVADIKQRSVRGGMITVTAQGIRFVLQMGSTMILARLLTPADFGLVAMVAAFTAFVGLFKDLGLTMATVQRAQVTHEQVTVLFWINVALSLVLVAICALSAPAVAWLYGEPRLALVTLAIAAQFLFAGLGAQHTALLRRHMRFGALATVEILSQLAGVVAAVALAWQGAGYWALVAMVGATTFTHMVLVWVLSPWRPGRPRRGVGAGEMIRFGGHLTGFNFVNYFTRHMDHVMLGAAWGAASLGIYSKAYGLLMLPLQQINAPLAAVAIPGLSRLQAEPERFRRFYCRMIQLIAYATMPLVVLMGILAEEIVLALLGAQWIEAATVFRIFAFFGFSQAVVVTTGWVLMALGRASRMLRWGVFQSALIMVAFALGLPWGATGVAVGATIFSCLIVLPTIVYALHDTPISLRDFGSAVARPLALSVLVLAAGLATRLGVEGWSPVGRVAAVLAAALAAVLLTVGCWRALREDGRGILALARQT